MAPDGVLEEHHAFLSQQIIADFKTVNYRLLSRHLKVNVTMAKKMLYDFYTRHRSLDAKPPVYATYLLTGLVRPSPPSPPASSDTNLESQDGDTTMRDSPMRDMSPSDLLSQTNGEDSSQLASQTADQSDVPLEKRIVVVPQEALEATKRTFVRLLSVSIYSLSPGVRLTDLGVLAEPAAEAISIFLPTDDPLASRRVYGSIINPTAALRADRQPLPPPAAPAVAANTLTPKPGAAPSGMQPGEAAGLTSRNNTTAAKPASTRSAAATEFFARKSTGAKASTAPAKPAPAAQPKKPKSSMLSAFLTAGGAQKPPLNPPAAAGGASSVPVETKMDVDSQKTDAAQDAEEEEEEGEEETQEDTVMADAADDSDFDPTPPENDLLPPPSTADDSAAKEAARKRKQREDELLAMMEDDEEDKITPPPPKKASVTPEPPLQQPEARKGRRKVRKQVKKKVQETDEDGYLVTREIMEWVEESESEPEVVVVKKPLAMKKEAKEGGEKKKAPASKGARARGQQSLTSFFSKKQT